MSKAFFILLASLLLACATQRGGQSAAPGAAQVDKVEKKAKVTLAIFSGRENPSWELTPEQTGEVESLLSELPPLDAKPEFSDDLGYRGFHVLLTDTRSDEQREVTAYKGQVRYRVGDEKKFLKDKDRRLERLLLKSGGSHLTPALSKAVAGEIEAP